MDDDDEVTSAIGDGAGDGEDFATPTPRRTTFMRTRNSGRASDVGSAAGGKRLSVSRLPAPTSGRMSFGGVPDGRPSSSKSNQSFAGLMGVGEDGDDETF